MNRAYLEERIENINACLTQLGAPERYTLEVYRTGARVLYGLSNADGRTVLEAMPLAEANKAIFALSWLVKANFIHPLQREMSEKRQQAAQAV